MSKELNWVRKSPIVHGWYWILRGDYKKTNLMYLDTSVRGGAPDDVIAFAGPVLPPPIDPLALYADDDDSKREEDEARTEHHEQGDR